MLSKLRYVARKDAADLASDRARLPVSSLGACFPGQVIQTRSVEGGTLGACFIVVRDAKEMFLKTHIDPQGARALSKEIGVLGSLYEGQLQIESFDCAINGNPHLWLMMDMLAHHPGEWSPVQVQALIRDFARALENSTAASFVPVADNFAALQTEGVQAQEYLAGLGLLSREVVVKLESLLTRLADVSKHLDAALCHGDLGPRNLMTSGDRVFAIDWEDAFWGIEGYDYLYWLTFMSNRKHYADGVLGKTPMDKDIEIAVMALIVLLKCYLSHRLGQHRDNQLSFDQRLGEIFTLH